MSIPKWKKQTNRVELIATATLNSLGAGVGVPGSGTTNNQSDSDRDGYPFADVELYLPAPVTAWADGARLELYFLRRTDGSNYETAGTNTPPNRAPDAVFWPVAGNGAQYLYGTNPQTEGLDVAVPTGDFKPYLFNAAGSGTTMAASGNTLYGRFKTLENV